MVQVAISPDKDRVDEVVKKYRDAGYKVTTSNTSRGLRILVGNEKQKKKQKHCVLRLPQILVSLHRVLLCIKPNNHKIRWVNCPVKWQNVDKRHTFYIALIQKRIKYWIIILFMD